VTRQDAASSTPTPHDPVVRAVTALMGAVVGLTFLFGFGNVWALALSLGVVPWVAPLVAPAVDLSILGLLLAIRRLVLEGVDRSLIAPARRLLIVTSLMTLALNVAEPLINHEYGRAAFDAVGPVLLIGWAEVGPGLLEAMNGPARRPARPANDRSDGDSEWHADKEVLTDPEQHAKDLHLKTRSGESPTDAPTLLMRALAADERHWAAHRRPISAETLRKELRIGASRSRALVTQLRVVDQPGTTHPLASFRM
jgi:hypothetical protein